MRPSSLVRRVSSIERIVVARRRTHYLWQHEDESDAAVQARIDAKIASGEAGPNDQFVIFRWRSPAGGGC
jgi:hypothetical protein